MGPGRRWLSWCSGAILRPILPVQVAPSGAGWHSGIELAGCDCAKRLQGLREIISTVLIAHIGSNGDCLPLRDDPLTAAGIVIVVRCETESRPNGRAQTASGVRAENLTSAR